MNRKILCVDDEPKVLSALRRQLHGEFDITISSNPVEALGIVAEQGPFAVVLADMRMPGMDGVELLEKVRSRAPETVRVMLTGNSDQMTAVEAVNRGAVFRFLSKPCPKENLVETLQSAVEQYRLIVTERDLLQDTLNGCIRVLTEILSMAAPTTFHRAIQNRQPAKKLAVAEGHPSPWEVETAAMLSHIGSLTLPSETLSKIENGTQLEEQELGLLYNVPSISARLIQSIPRMEGVAAILRAYAEGEPTDEATAIGTKILRQLFRQEQALTHPQPTGPLPADADAEPQYSESGQELVTVPIRFKDLRAGHVLAAPIETHRGMKIVTDGQMITAVMLERISNHKQISGIVEPIYIRKLAAKPVRRR